MGKAIRTSPRTRPGKPGPAAVLAVPGQADGAAPCAAEDARSLPFDLRPATCPIGIGPGGRPRPRTVGLEDKGPRVATRAEATSGAGNAWVRGRTSVGTGGVPVNRGWPGENLVSVAQPFGLLAASRAARRPKALQAKAGGPPKAAGALHSHAPEQAGCRHAVVDVPRTALPSGTATGTATGTASGSDGGPDEGPAVRASAGPAVPPVAARPRPRSGGPRPGSLVPLGG
jgi:hypothetical protein